MPCPAPSSPIIVNHIFCTCLAPLSSEPDELQATTDATDVIPEDSAMLLTYVMYMMVDPLHHIMVALQHVCVSKRKLKLKLTHLYLKTHMRHTSPPPLYITLVIRDSLPIQNKQGGMGMMPPPLAQACWPPSTSRTSSSSSIWPSPPPPSTTPRGAHFRSLLSTPRS